MGWNWSPVKLETVINTLLHLKSIWHVFTMSLCWIIALVNWSVGRSWQDHACTCFGAFLQTRLKFLSNYTQKLNYAKVILSHKIFKSIEWIVFNFSFTDWCLFNRHLGAKCSLAGELWNELVSICVHRKADSSRPWRMISFLLSLCVLPSV